MPRARRLCKWSSRTLPDGTVVLAHLADAGRADCAEHRRLHEQLRGSPAARGYGSQHRAVRARWAPHVAAGRVSCWRCGQLIGADEPWDLGHEPGDRERYAGPEHRRCNRRDGGQRRWAPGGGAGPPAEPF